MVIAIPALAGMAKNRKQTSFLFLLFGRLDGLFDSRWSRLLFDADDAGRERAHEKNVTAIVARRCNDGLDGALCRDATTREFAELEHRVFDLPLPRTTHGTRVTENVLEMLLKTGATFWIELHV